MAVLDGNTAEELTFSIYVVTLQYEFFPGREATAAISRNFHRNDIAQQSLEFMRQKYPDARLWEYVQRFFTNKEEDMKEYRRLTKLAERENAA